MNTVLADSYLEENWAISAVQGMIDEMIEDKITQDLQCFQSSLANSPHNDILWTCLVFLAASRQVWTIYWIIHPALTVSCFIMVFVINITKKVNDCCQWMFHFSHFSACSNLRLWHERRHPAPSSWPQLMTGAQQPIRGQSLGQVTNEKPRLCRDGDNWCKPRKFQTLVMKDVLRVIRNFARYALPLINL